MWDKYRKMVRENEIARYELECEVWVALDELGELSQEMILGSEQIRVSLHEVDDVLYYIRPGSSCIYSLSADKYGQGCYSGAETVAIESCPSRVLCAVLRFAEQ